jgi:methylated-DNA-protein-cysteine methyltransferase-like protein
MTFVFSESALNIEPETLNSKKDSFFQDVWDVVKLIPKGRVTSYGAIAKYLGSPGAARMVGWAMNASHSATEPVPAQRVVNRIGMLSGAAHFSGPNLMQELLESEGIKVENNQVVDFESHFWDPMTELGLG